MTGGEAVTIPRLPPVTNVYKPLGWRRWSEAEKVQHLLGLSVDRILDYLSWSLARLDPHRLAAQTQVVRVVAMVAAKVGVEAQRERQQVLAALVQMMPTHLRTLQQPR